MIIACGTVTRQTFPSQLASEVTLKLPGKLPRPPAWHRMLRARVPGVGPRALRRRLSPPRQVPSFGIISRRVPCFGIISRPAAGLESIPAALPVWNHFPPRSLFGIVSPRRGVPCLESESFPAFLALSSQSPSGPAGGRGAPNGYGLGRGAAGPRGATSAARARAKLHVRTGPGRATPDRLLGPGRSTFSVRTGPGCAGSTARARAELQ